MSAHKAPEKEAPPPYVDTTDTTDTTPANHNPAPNASPPAYDFTDNTHLAVDEKKSRVSIDAHSLAPSAASDDGHASSSTTPVTWHLYLESREKHTLLVYGPEKSQPRYRITFGRAPHVLLQSMPSGAEVGRATFAKLTTVVGLDIHGHEMIECLTTDDKARDYAYASPGLDRRLKWEHKTTLGHVNKVVCVDERGEEVAAWKRGKGEKRKVGVLEFQGWVQGEGGEEGRKRMEEVLLVAMVMQLKMKYRGSDWDLISAGGMALGMVSLLGGLGS
ncbi:hypothetical protein B9Z65_3550 [Elsinoe australis]|uniref:Uncharacterized protein n=1 Tax=Elsinoe australis TaxID=40998 RepID=A0A2P8AFI2_9PEZI|nr:hypothetical protein B9Z65_3550 [Elsinoe australis]